MNQAAKVLTGATACVVVFLATSLLLRSIGPSPASVPGRGSSATVDAGGEDEGTGAEMSAATIVPDALPGKQAQLVVQGTKIPIAIRREVRGADVLLKIAVHDEPYETEAYRSTLQSYQLVSAADETFEPPIPLLKFPARLGASWDWAGTMGFGGARKAVARVQTSSDKLFVNAVPLNTVKVVVSLAIDANPPGGPRAKRDLTFWFCPGKGIVRRDFGAGSVREPLDKS